MVRTPKQRIEQPSALGRHALECLLRPPRCCLIYDVLPLRKNDHTGADLRAAQEGALHTAKIGNGILRKVHYEFFNPSTVTIALPHHHLTTSARSGPHVALTGTVL